MRSQPKVGYKRRGYGTAVIKEIEARLESESKRYGVSKSFVIANALAFTFGIDVEPYIIVKATRTRARMKVK